MTIENIPTRLADHPTVRKVRSRKTEKPGVIDADWLRQVCLDAGADDVAFASVENPDLAGEREHVDAALPGVQSYISLVVKMNRDNVRSTARSVTFLPFSMLIFSSIPTDFGGWFGEGCPPSKPPPPSSVW